MLSVIKFEQLPERRNLSTASARVRDFTRIKPADKLPVFTKIMKQFALFALFFASPAWRAIAAAPKPSDILFIYTNGHSRRTVS